MSIKKGFTLTFFFPLLLLILTACLPEPNVREVPDNNVEELSNGNEEVEDNKGLQYRTFPGSANFLQEGATQTSNLSLFADFNDTFLVRGNNIVNYLKDAVKVSQAPVCLVLEFPNTAAKNTLIVSARIRSFISTQLLTKEYYFQVDPKDSTINQSDCFTVNLQNKVLASNPSATFAFDIKDICPDCKTSLTSRSLNAYDRLGNKINDLNVSPLFLTLLPKLGTVVESGQTCSTDASCNSFGFNCCLQNQCVNHGETRPNVVQTSDKYKIAVEQIQSRPDLIKKYEDLFYVCPNMVPEDPDNSSDDPSSDPLQDSNNLLEELGDLFSCINPVIDEFSICSRSYTEASSKMATSSFSFETENDDITFRNLNTNFNFNNIVNIEFAGKTYFNEKIFSSDTQIDLDPSVGSLSASNDLLSRAQAANLQIALPSDAANDIVKLSYRVDGTCEKLGANLARCKKFYTQGQLSIPTRSSDHDSSSNLFLIPSYADLSFNIDVKVGGTSVPKGSDTWSLVGSGIQFDDEEFPIFNNQKIEITYFVTNNVDQLTKSKEAAQTAVNNHCNCDPENDCNLAPQRTDVNGENRITSYSCVYPDNREQGPLQETVYLSAKTVPHKFFDENGIYYDPEDVGEAFTQEGEEFFYDRGNPLKPINENKYIGFNEIYGSFNGADDAPMPAVVLDLEKGKNYDIFVDEGSFSTCLNCGTDYFSRLQKIFPNNFALKGAGYRPDFVESRRQRNQGDFNADDMLFGRACFVPATMIPWTHRSNPDVQQQRLNRLQAQHFLFANGYNKDWYGFDYGSIIGSFDGVTWFSIGGQRRIKAGSNKLFIAVNAYFGDLTINNIFKIIISEMSSVINSGSFITHDTDSTGAECQKAHFCAVDEDCIAQLGYDYACESVANFFTSWPEFDSSGNEISGGRITSLLSLVGGSNGIPKRCIYRGKGAVCEPRSQSVIASNSYTDSSLPALHSCSPNSYCQSISRSEFNTKIARYGDSPATQNNQSFITEKTDTFGLGARIIGRPFKYFGDSPAPSTVATQLISQNVNALCIPGKDPVNDLDTEDLNFKFDSADREADKIGNVGKTYPVSILQDPNYYSSCPSTDEEGNYTHYEAGLLTNDKHAPFAITNNLSTNALDLDIFQSSNFFNDDDSLISKIGYNKNSCLRAPGAKCFTDFECAPNSFIATKVKSISNFNGELSLPEQNFWKEELVCANSQDRYLPNSTFQNPDYETFEHHCCRETSKSFTYFSQPHENSDFKVVDGAGTPLIPGVNQDLNSPERYSRTHTVYDKLISEPGNFPPMVTASPRPNSPLALALSSIKQYNTLNLHNSRMCCTGNWVRSFASGSNGNGGGYEFTAESGQNIPMSTFRTLSWNPNNNPAINRFPSAYDPQFLAFTCTPEDYQTADCEVKNIIEGSTEEEKFLTWFSKFELIGIPQVLIETNNTIERPIGDASVDGTETDQTDISGQRKPMPNTIEDINGAGIADATFEGTEYYSAASYENFKIGSGRLKKVFSENEFNCCLPTGLKLPSDTKNNECCTGQSLSVDDGEAKVCCLQDFTDVSVYTNRYVSSEGAFFNGQEVRDSDIDPTTGYIRKEIVLQMARTMCCSGRVGFGSAIGNYLIPINYDEKIGDAKTRRWVYLDQFDTATESGQPAIKYQQGLKWNNHVYCLPPSDSDDGGSSGGGSGSGSVNDS